MTDELYTLYQNDKSFKEYVDKWCKKYDLGIFEAFRLNVLQEYAKFLKEGNK